MEEPKGKYPVRTEGPMYLHQMPTEKIQAQLDETKEELARVRGLLVQALATRCPDPSCRNCGRWRAWYSEWGPDWYRCPDCGTGPGKPCWDKRAAQGQLVRGRPHARRKPVSGGPDPLAEAPRQP